MVPARRRASPGLRSRPVSRDHSRERRSIPHFQGIPRYHQPRPGARRELAGQSEVAVDQEGAVEDKSESTPIFAAFRRGYDPEQVDRYVADQRRRLDDAVQRASEAERKLAAAVGQLRELHRRIAVLESEDRNATPAIDAIGERIQRILQEAWDSAYAMRQAAESDASELRERAKQEADEILAEARRKARDLGAALERRRESFLQRVDEERTKAVAQTTFLQEQRKLAIEELVRIRTRLDGTIGEFGGRQPARLAPRGDPARSDDPRVIEPDHAPASPRRERESTPPRRELERSSRPVTLVAPAREQQARAHGHSPSGRVVATERPADGRVHPPMDRQPDRSPSSEDPARTMPVHHLVSTDVAYERDPSELVRLYRAGREPADDRLAAPPSPAGVFDFEATADEADEIER